MQVNQATSIRVFILGIGILNVFVFAGYSILSYGLAPLIPFNLVGPSQVQMSESLATFFSVLGEPVAEFLRGQSFLAVEQNWIIAYCIPVVLSSLIFLVLLMAIAHYRTSIDATIPRLLFGFSVVFAIICAAAHPVLVLDFWYPISWGRMVVAGINPYYASMPSEFIQDLPLGPNEAVERMMYGPLWALGYGAVMWFADQHAWLAAVIFKALIAGAWIGTVSLVWLLLKKLSIWHQCVGLLIIGWLPVGVLQGVAEGHNDVIMIFFLVSWLYLLESGRPAAARVMLGCSVLIKYVTAPLFLLDFLHSWFSQKRSLLYYVSRSILPGIFIVAIFGIFIRSLDFFAYLPRTSSWHFYSPKEAVLALESMLGIWIPNADSATRAIFPMLALYLIMRYVQSPQRERFHLALLGVMCAMLFGVTSHVWPWYILWALAIAALNPGAALTRWAIGVALATPFPILMWVVYPDASNQAVFMRPALYYYTFALLWFIFALRRWFPQPTSAIAVALASPLVNAGELASEPVK